VINNNIESSSVVEDRLLVSFQNLTGHTTETAHTLETENIKPIDNIDSTSNLVNTTTHQDDDENILSIAEIETTSIISNRTDLHFSKPIRSRSQSPPQKTPTLNVILAAEDDLQRIERVLEDDIPPLLDDVSDDEMDTSPSLLSLNTTQDICLPVQKVPLNDPSSENHVTEQGNDSKFMEQNLITTLGSCSIGQRELIPEIRNFLDLNSSQKSNNISCTGRTVHFKEEISIPTVSVMKNTSHIRVTKAPLIHSVTVLLIENKCFQCSNTINDESSVTLLMIQTSMY